MVKIWEIVQKTQNMTNKRHSLLNPAERRMKVRWRSISEGVIDQNKSSPPEPMDDIGARLARWQQMKIYIDVKILHFWFDLPDLSQRKKILDLLFIDPRGVGGLHWPIHSRYIRDIRMHNSIVIYWENIVHQYFCQRVYTKEFTNFTRPAKLWAAK